MLRHFRPRSHPLDFPLARGRGPRDFRTRRSLARASPSMAAHSGSISRNWILDATLSHARAAPRDAAAGALLHAGPSSSLGGGHANGGQRGSSHRPQDGQVGEARRLPSPLSRRRVGQAAARASARFDARVLFVDAGDGARLEPVGIDRGADGASHVARFERDGPRCWWCSRTGTTAAPRARTRRISARCAEAFPPSTVAALPLVADEGGRLLVDATEFADARLERRRRDAGDERSRGRTPWRATGRASTGHTRTHFPSNTEIDVALTFATTGGTAGAIVESHRARRPRVHAAPASVAAASCPTTCLPPARARSARRLFRHHVQGLRAADPAAARAALDRAPPARARESGRSATVRSRIRSSTTSTAAFPSRCARRRCRA